MVYWYPRSPSARKVWIEITSQPLWLWGISVTFRKEGVDWNSLISISPVSFSRHLPQGRCGLKSVTAFEKMPVTSSPSARKVWIEIQSKAGRTYMNFVTFRKEGVDWNLCETWYEKSYKSHLPQGRCGLKLRTYKIGKCPSCHLPQGRCGLKLRLYHF